MAQKMGKSILTRWVYLAMKLMSLAMPVLLIMQANASACSINGQPTPPDSLKNYRKF